MPTLGIILCGGQSSRMGTDKSSIVYHSKPQWEHLYHILKPLCDDVVVSCNTTQIPLFDGNVEYVVDEDQFAHSGPIAGLLSAMHHYPNHSYLIIGCDYPGIQTDDIKALLAQASLPNEVVCFRNPVSNMDEPLMAWYHNNTIRHIEKAFQEGEKSLRKLIERFQTTRVIPDEWNQLFSIDTPDQRNQWH